MSGGEILTGIVSGTGATAATAALLYGVRQIRKIAARIEEVMSAPREITELRAVVAQNTTAISHLSSALERIARLAESRQGAERPTS